VKTTSPAQWNNKQTENVLEASMKRWLSWHFRLQVFKNSPKWQLWVAEATFFPAENASFQPKIPLLATVILYAVGCCKCRHHEQKIRKDRIFSNLFEKRKQTNCEES